MGLSWKWSILEVFCRLMFGGLGPFPMGSIAQPIQMKYFMGGRHYWSLTRICKKTSDILHFQLWPPCNRTIRVYIFLDLCFMIPFGLKIHWDPFRLSSGATFRGRYWTDKVHSGRWLTMCPEAEPATKGMSVCPPVLPCSHISPFAFTSTRWWLKERFSIMWTLMTSSISLVYVYIVY